MDENSVNQTDRTSNSCELPQNGTDPMNETLLCTQFEVVGLVESLADRIRASYKPSVMVPIMNGAFLFAADLLKHLHRRGVDMEVEPFRFKRNRLGAPTLEYACSPLWFGGRNVLLVDTIYCTGGTAKAASNYLHRASNVAFAFLFARGEQPPELAGSVFVGKQLGGNKDYLVGYGLDRNGKCRGQDRITLEAASDEVPESRMVR